MQLRINADAPESTQKAQAALTNAFKADDIDALAQKAPNVMDAKYGTAIHVMIGAKM